MSVSPSRRFGQILTGFGALTVLIGLLVGAPLALLAFAGNPLPDHVPTFAEIGSVLTSRDDGELFLRALAVVGWAGWATFALSVLVELPARALRRAAPRLPGMRRQQRLAATLIGSTALILVASPATAAMAGTVAPPPVVATAPPAAAPAWATLPASTGAVPSGAAYFTPIRAAAPEAAPHYRVERGDYLGAIADRYLGEFDAYPRLARLNDIDNPSLIHPGQLIRLPDAAHDGGLRPHATGLVTVTGPDAPAPPQGGNPGRPEPAQPPAPEDPEEPRQPVPPAPPSQSTPPPAPPSEPAVPPPPAPPADGSAPPADPAQPPADPAQPPADPAQPPADPAQPPVDPVQPPPAPPAPVPPDPSAGPEEEPLPQPAPPDPALPLPPAERGEPNYASGAPGGGLDVNQPLAVSAVLTAASIVGAQAGTVLGLRRRTAGQPADSGRHRAAPD